MVEIKRKKLGRLPTRIGTLIDKRYELRQQAAVLEHEIKKIKEEMQRVEDALFLTYKNSEITGARGKIAQASVSELIVPTGDDWDLIYKYIRRGKGDSRFDLLGKSLASRAVKERWDDEISIPGVGSFKKIRLNVTKLK